LYLGARLRHAITAGTVKYVRGRDRGPLNVTRVQPNVGGSCGSVSIFECTDFKEDPDARARASREPGPQGMDLVSVLAKPAWRGDLHPLSGSSPSTTI
jgi:hypothetical protein